MTGGWLTVWEIASRRHGTKMGADTLTPHGYAVLEAFALREQQEAMSQALGNMVLEKLQRG